MEAIAIVIEVMLLILKNLVLAFAGVIIAITVIQLISYRIFNFNLYQKIKYIFIDSEIK